jgi:hypothetical protein
MVPPVHRKLITSSLMLTVATLNGIVPRGRARVTLGGLRRFPTIWVLSCPLHRNRYRPSITPLKPNHDHSSDVIVIECGSIMWCYTPDNNSLIVRSHYASKGVGRNNRGNGLAHCVPTLVLFSLNSDVYLRRVRRPFGRYNSKT